MFRLSVDGYFYEAENKIAHQINRLGDIDKKLAIAYAYKDQLFDAMRQADERIKEVQQEYFATVNDIRDIQGKLQEDVIKRIKSITTF